MRIYGYWGHSRQPVGVERLHFMKMKEGVKRISTFLELVYRVFTFNLKIIFANKFVYFLMGAVAFYLLIVLSNLFDAEAYFAEPDVYYLLLFPGLLVIFYPSTFGIQNDADTRMLEILFGIPDYRYKVWLVRLIIIFFVVYGVLLVLSFFSTLALVPVPVFGMSYQLMYPVVFMGALGFMFSTLIRNGSGSAAIMIICGLIVWISSGILETNEWNIFLNPYEIPESLSQVMWAEMLFYNRLYLLIGSLLAILVGLYRLQYREKFV